MNNFANGLIDTNLKDSSFTTPWEFNGVSYLKIEESGTAKQNAYWEPIEFNDTTYKGYFKNMITQNIDVKRNTDTYSHFCMF